MVTYKLTDSEDNTSEITWSAVNPINGKTGYTDFIPDGETIKSWQYCYIPYSEQYKKFTIKIKNSDKDTDFYVVLQAAGGQAGKKSDSGAAGGGGGGQTYSRKIAGGDTITIKVVLANIGDSSDSTITVNSGNTVVVGNGQDGGDGNNSTFTTVYKESTSEVLYVNFPDYYSIEVGDAANGGSGSNVTQQADLDDTNTPGYIYGGGGGNASNVAKYTVITDNVDNLSPQYYYAGYKITDAGKDGTPGNGYNSAGSGTTGDDSSPGSYSLAFEDGTSATTCSGGVAGGEAFLQFYYSFDDDLNIIPEVNILSKPTDAEAGNTPWFLLYFIETITLS